MIWEMLHPRMTLYQLGFIPSFLSEDNPKSAREQINDNYGHGGGWHPTPGHTMDKDDYSIKYPGDPRLFPLARTMLRHEIILFYQHDLLAIVQPDGSFEISRVD
jgi:hypothetical protein